MACRAEVRNTAQERPIKRGVAQKKLANLLRLAIFNWWRWGELNPRPPAFRLQIYMRSPVFNFRLQLPDGHGSLLLIPLGF
jgi:hypothetical protein